MMRPAILRAALALILILTLPIAAATYAPSPLKLPANLYLDLCLDKPTADQDGDWLKDDLENALAEYFAPYLRFDSDESDTAFGEPVVVFQVTPGEGSSAAGCVGAACPSPMYVDIKYGLLWFYDGGYPYSENKSTFWCTFDTHIGDNQSLVVTLWSWDGGRTWQFLRTDGDAHGNPFPQEQYGKSHPVLYLSDGKHHQYWTASSSIEYPGTTGNCDDAVDGNHKTLNGLPDLKSVFSDGRYNNVGEPNRLGKEHFVDCLPSFSPVPVFGLSGPAHCKGSMSAWGQSFYAMSHESRPFWLRNKVTAFKPGTTPPLEFDEMPLPSGHLRFSAEGTLAIHSSDCRDFELADYMDVNARIDYQAHVVGSSPASSKKPSAALDPGHKPEVSLQQATPASGSTGALETKSAVGVCPGQRTLCVEAPGPSSPTDAEYWCYEVRVDTVGPSVLQPDRFEQAGNDSFTSAVYLGPGTRIQQGFGTGDTVWKVQGLTHHSSDHKDLNFFSITLPKGTHVVDSASGPQEWKECIQSQQFITAGGLVKVTRYPGSLIVQVHRNEPFDCDNGRPVKIAVYDEKQSTVDVTTFNTHSGSWVRECPNSVFSDVNGSQGIEVTIAIEDPVSRGPYELLVTYRPSGWVGKLFRLLPRPPEVWLPPWRGVDWGPPVLLTDLWEESEFLLEFPADPQAFESGDLFELDVGAISGRAQAMEFETRPGSALEVQLLSQEGRLVRRAQRLTEEAEEATTLRLNLRDLPAAKHFLLVKAGTEQLPYAVRFVELDR